ncbi:hypothetical protein [Plesiomonas shigelloides]|uniref:hypothetical protein n=1 Tax=Plesiomonas shigelloides TaxID=703 RepID=UPI0006924192|nr:hypothetical protein [Plesiomonas shigelloides]
MSGELNSAATAIASGLIAKGEKSTLFCVVGIDAIVIVIINYGRYLKRGCISTGVNIPVDGAAQSTLLTKIKLPKVMLMRS